MLNKLIDLGIENRLLVVLALIATMVGGVLILPKLNLDAFPDVTNVQVQINTEARGLAAEEVEQLSSSPSLSRRSCMHCPMLRKCARSRRPACL